MYLSQNFVLKYADDSVSEVPDYELEYQSWVLGMVISLHHQVKTASDVHLASYPINTGVNVNTHLNYCQGWEFLELYSSMYLQ
jgi:hypothetical protein